MRNFKAENLKTDIETLENTLAEVGNSKSRHGERGRIKEQIKNFESQLSNLDFNFKIPKAPWSVVNEEDKFGFRHGDIRDSDDNLILENEMTFSTSQEMSERDEFLQMKFNVSKAASLIPEMIDALKELQFGATLTAMVKSKLILEELGIKKTSPNDIYKEQGYLDRGDYLKQLSDQYNIPLESTLKLAEILGKEEDFDGLVEMVETWVRANSSS